METLESWFNLKKLQIGKSLAVSKELFVVLSIKQDICKSLEKQIMVIILNYHKKIFYFLELKGKQNVLFCLIYY